MTPHDINQINRRLALNYGFTLIGLPYFRLAFSDNLTEKRFGVYAEFYGKIFIREIRGLREVPKYSFLKGRWVLERWIPPVYAHTPEVPATSEGSYEPIFVFQGEDGKALEVSEEWCEKVIWNLLHPMLDGHKQSVERTRDELAMEKEIEWHRMVLEDQGRSHIGHRLHSGEGIGYRGNPDKCPLVIL
jgi:hypothetical protein